MSSPEDRDDLLAALRRSTDPADRLVADRLTRLARSATIGTTVPRPSPALRAFLDGGSLEGDQVVTLAPRPPRRSAMRSPVLVPLHKVLKMGLLAKVMLGATVALTGAGTAAATGILPTGDDQQVVVTPAGDRDPTVPTLPTESPDVEEEATEPADDEPDGDEAEADADGPGDVDEADVDEPDEAHEADDDVDDDRPHQGAQSHDAEDEADDADEAGDDEAGDDADEADEADDTEDEAGDDKD